MTGRVGVRLLLAAVVGVPLAVLAAAAFSIRWVWPQVVPAEPSLIGVRRVFDAAGTGAAVWDGISVSILVTAIALAVSWPAARALADPLTSARGGALGLLFLPSLVPAVGLAMSVAVGLLNLGVDGSFGAVVAAHLIPVVPYVTATLTATFLRLDPRVEQQARVLGASPLQVLRLTTVPTVLPGLAAAAALGFVVSWSQYLLTLLAGGGRIITVTMLLFNSVSGGNPSTIGVLALLCAAPVISLTFVTARATRQATR